MIFYDYNGNEVVLTIKDTTDIPMSKHVLMITNYQQQLLLTHHKVRGIEFPGGKTEEGESTIEAMYRELFEETGGKVARYRFIGTYTVNETVPFNKDVFYVEVDAIEQRKDYLETKGPVIVRTLNEIAECDKSELLKDDCILYLYDMLKDEYDVK